MADKHDKLWDAIRELTSAAHSSLYYQAVHNPEQPVEAVARVEVRRYAYNIKNTTVTLTQTLTVPTEEEATDEES